MDGVISDIDRTMAKHLDVSHEEILQSRSFRTECYLRWVREVGSLRRGFASLLPTRLGEMKALFRDLRKEGHSLDLLTSLGAERGLFDHTDHLTVGMEIHAGKVDWIKTHYNDLFEEEVINQLHAVAECGQKRLFGKPETLLIDDQPENVRGFIEEGGRGYHYHVTRHEELESFLHNEGILSKPNVR